MRRAAPPPASGRAGPPRCGGCRCGGKCGPDGLAPLEGLGRGPCRCGGKCGPDGLAPPGGARPGPLSLRRVSLRRAGAAVPSACFWGRAPRRSVTWPGPAGCVPPPFGCPARRPTLTKARCNLSTSGVSYGHTTSTKGGANLLRKAERRAHVLYLW